MNKTQALKTPFLDLISPHVELEDELVSVFRDALREASFIGGPALASFEDNYARFCGTEHCVGVANGTDALRLALIASGVKPGDTVVTVANTFIATVEAISQSGAKPAFIDIDEATFNMAPESLLEYLEARCDISSDGRPFDRRTKSPVTAVVPVHLYGQPCDMDAILEIAAKYGLIVVEDACQAHGAEYFSKKEGGWKKAGAFGAAAAFSFYPGKNLGACGDGGAVTTGSKDIAGRIKMLRDHGQSRKYHHEIEGFNSRLDSIQAAFLDVKLKRLSGWNEMRRACAWTYGELLSGSNDVIVPEERENAKHVYHLYIIRVKDRDGLQKRLGEEGIATGLHYPLPLHLQNAYKGLGYKMGDLPVTERVSSVILSLPMYPGLSCLQQQRVADIILNT
ncbi:MAG: erythromycin biosynthesis sensory transduction protein eryC1 [Deltaproteobacteria bacterium GWA2_55_10]|nr:MAG: erythromycin biosynthesis sensory transduction protein eryC1 [Deltaproteobacteria bacterium GWA2_55_10]